MNNGYIVRFIRMDKKENEEYFYHSFNDAISHLEQFRNDDSELFRRIEVIDSYTLHLPYAVLEFQSADCFV